MSPVNTTDTMANSIRTRFENAYEEAVYAKRVYDQVASVQGRDLSKLNKGDTVQLTFQSKMDIGTTVISEYTDRTPQVLKDANVTFQPTSRGEALQKSELLKIQNFALNADSELMKVISENAVESIDLLAQIQALQGALVNRAAARASLDAGTAGHRLTELNFSKSSVELVNLKSPRFPGTHEMAGKWAAIMPGEAYYDVRTGGNVVSVAQYQKAGIILNEELGALGDFKILVSPWAKVFGSAGLDNGSNVATTLNGAVLKLAKTIIVAANTNIVQGQWLTIGTEETGDTFYEGNERVKVASVNGTTITIVGQGSNGGLRFNHASGVAVRNADSVYPVLYAGPESLAKIYDLNTGEFGKFIAPWEDGLLKQWTNVAWKFYGAYARYAENRLVRSEHSSSLDA